MVARQVFYGGHLQALGFDELAQAQQVDVFEHAAISQAGGVHDDVGDAELSGAAEVLFGEVRWGKFETEFHDCSPDDRIDESSWHGSGAGYLG